MADGFLGRWSRRKLDVVEGKPVAPEPALPVPPVAPQAAAPAAAPVVATAGQAREEPPLPTLEDVEALTPESDFSAFTGRKVQPEVRNAAMKKLFADPHYNVMDMMDVYVDDYSRPDPMPASMLRQLASAKFLNLFDEDEEGKGKPGAESPATALGGDGADGLAAPDVAQSGLCSDLPSQPPGVLPEASQPDHDDPDLRLQQDHATPGKTPGGGTQ